MFNSNAIRIHLDAIEANRESVRYWAKTLREHGVYCSGPSRGIAISAKAQSMGRIAKWNRWARAIAAKGMIPEESKVGIIREGNRIYLGVINKE